MASARTTQADVELAGVQEWSRVQRAVRLYDFLTTAIVAVVALGIVGVIGWSFVSIARATAGMDTSLSATLEASVELITKMSLDRWAAWFLAGLFGGGWVWERRVHRRDIAEKSADIRRYEQLLHPESSRSGLDLDERVPRTRREP